MMKTDRQTRQRLVCRGTVQGVGFRPSVYRLATSLTLGGWVLNSPQGVIIEIQGLPETLDRFTETLPSTIPSLADLQSVESSTIPLEIWVPFQILRSEGGEAARGSLPPDSALCDECRNDMEDPSNRRYQYPFTTCSNCGPRFSVVKALPYDRERTSMACFPMCPDCEREYTDPLDRRFHAEPLACPACGPRLSVIGSDGGELGNEEDALDTARGALSEGKILAVKGTRRIQLACRADWNDSVENLRIQKRRERKPFAVMARDIETARRCVHLHPSGEELLQSAAAPILLCPRRMDGPVQDAVAPGLDDLGIMLPTTPLHVELFRETDYNILIMTSGNVTDEPICCGNREALDRLKGIADLFLLHNRDVVRRLDDSVVRSDSGSHYSVRRSRGSVPQTMPLPETLPHPVLALGGHLQTTACLSIEDRAVNSQHVGDLDNEKAREFLLESAHGLEELMQTRASGIAVDLHPDYSSRWIGEALSKERGIPLYQFQHHLAHAAAVLGEHRQFPRIDETSAAIVLDGTGWGPDGTAWGGEWLLLDGTLKWRRIAHLEPIPLVGGEKAVREPWRFLCSALTKIGRQDLLKELPMAAELTGERLDTVCRLSHSGNWPLSSGAGRLFEAAGALLGLTLNNCYEGEAAALLEAKASGIEEGSDWPEVSILPGSVPCLPVSELLLAAGNRFAGGASAAEVARGFHETFCRLVVDLAVETIPDKVRTIALGGGCFVNRILRRGLRERLTRAGFRVLLPKEVPAGDGGLSYGQSVLTAVSLARSTKPELG